MSMTVFRLMQAHQRLDREISVERQRKLPDPFRLQRLKRLKLKLKDRLARLGLGRANARA